MTLISYLVHQFLPVILIFIGAACLYLVAGVISIIDHKKRERP